MDDPRGGSDGKVRGLLPVIAGLRLLILCREPGMRERPCELLPTAAAATDACK